MIDYVERFLDYLRVERQYSEDTQKAYKSDLHEFIKFLGATNPDAKTVDLTEVTSLDVRVFLSYLYERGDSSRTIARKVSSLRSFYEFLERNEAIEQNPFAGVQLKKAGQHLPRYFYEKEIAQLFETAQQDHSALGQRNQLILELLYGTGMRVSELASLELGMIDQRAKVITVTGKGNKTRIVPYGQYAQKALEQYLQDGRRQLMKADSLPNHLLFNHQGKPLAAGGIEYALKQLGKAAGLTQKVTAHMFRHTFATDMLNNGADLRSVQQLLGHSSLSTTQIYTHVTTQSLQQNYRKFFPRANE
ncbi:tyrosine recombinase XerC [Weissella minor]|uniref:Tyrosine recombinase XerC n=1 Tax=Weissella minor TaxID=1620 RepID=A0A0R2JIM8_9LACO|nr:tyrosine recombinase XerC [Weissella minor]KRN77155.1 integrase recombinase [Weissella minor]